MGIGYDYRKVAYNPRSGRRTLAVCILMVIIGFGCLASPVSNYLAEKITIMGHQLSFEFVPIFLIGLGIFNAIPAVMMLNPPAKR